MMGMDIPEKAVEAGAKAIWDVDRDRSDREYEDCRDGTKRHLRREARAVLEAAAPYIIAGLAEQAWAEANENVPPNPTSYAWSDKCMAASEWLEAKAKAAGWVPPQPNNPDRSQP